MIIEKLTAPETHLTCDDLTPTQKKLLDEVMARHGAKWGLTYNRFFRFGFKEWELRGIDQIKRDFLEEHHDDIYSADGSVLLPPIDVIVSGNGMFYKILGMKVGMKKCFTEHMNTLGMGFNQAISKFSVDDWIDYERVGIRAIMEEFEREAAGT